MPQNDIRDDVSEKSIMDACSMQLRIVRPVRSAEYPCKEGFLCWWPIAEEAYIHPTTCKDCIKTGNHILNSSLDSELLLGF